MSYDFTSYYSRVASQGFISSEEDLPQDKSIKGTHREKPPSNETPVLTKSANMGIWVVGTTNQLFIRGS